MITRIPLVRHEDERGWFTELARASALPKPIRQANLVASRRGVIRAGRRWTSRRQSVRRSRATPDCTETTSPSRRGLRAW